jgi:perosamine synthetase
MLPPSIEFWTPQFGDEEKRLVNEVIDSGFLNEGQLTADFEHSIAEMLGCKHVVATTSGTAAIFLALTGISIGPGDEVIVPDVTFIATANAVSLTGAKPILVDVDPQKLTLDPECTEKAVSKRTRAIIPVHVSGRAADLGSILEIARRYGILVIEDAAEAFLSRHRGKCLGTFGIAGCFSLSPNKTITTGQGGLIATNDDRLHIRIRELKDQGRQRRGTGGDDLHNSLGYNFKLTDLQAAVGLGQIKQLPRRLDIMKTIYTIYAAELRDVEGVSVLPFCTETGEIPQWTDVVLRRRDELYEHLCARGMRSRRFWFPLHTQTPYRMADDRFPNSTKISAEAMWLPSAFTLRPNDILSVCNEIRTFLN